MTVPRAGLLRIAIAGLAGLVSSGNNSGLAGALRQASSEGWIARAIRQSAQAARACQVKGRLCASAIARKNGFSF